VVTIARALVTANKSKLSKSNQIKTIADLHGLIAGSPSTQKWKNMVL
jgi:hypothetical protein